MPSTIIFNRIQTHETDTSLSLISSNLLPNFGLCFGGQYCSHKLLEYIIPSLILVKCKLKRNAALLVVQKYDLQGFLTSIIKWQTGICFRRYCMGVKAGVVRVFPLWHEVNERYRIQRRCIGDVHVNKNVVSHNENMSLGFSVGNEDPFGITRDVFFAYFFPPAR